jgi:dimethylsulfide dehydrogenase subunit gamma/complex iron-sulfur molybdoenzyme family reductase subunit gamma
VLARRLTPASDDGVQLGGVRQVPVAFAIWNGSNQERDGFKGVTLEWWLPRF